MLTCAAVGAAILYFFDPTKYGFYPRCPLFLLTGWECPSCGTLRALHQLAHGHFAAAWRFNPLFVSLLPVALWLGLREFLWQFWGIGRSGFILKPLHGWTLTTIFLLFGIVRNLPVFH
jgi:Protein of unknown function (DUF2752)